MKLHLPKALVAALLLTVGTAYADYTWIGGSQEFTSGDQNGWNNASNWQETIPSGVTVAWDGGDDVPWQKMIFDAQNQADGTLTLTTCKLEGWALKMDVLNGAKVTVQDLNKIQGGGVINVDGVSDVTIKKITGQKSDGDTLTFNLTSSTTGHADEYYAARASLILGSSGKGGGNTIVNYGEINGDKKYGFFTLKSDDNATDRNHSGSLVLQASLTQTIVSESTTLHTIALAEVSHISFGTGSIIDFSGITSENFMLSTSALSESDEDIGKYYVWNDGGTIKLSYVTGDVSIKRANVAHGSAYTFTTLTGGESDVAALYLTVDPTPAPSGAATVNVTADSSVSNKLSVAGGTASVSVAEGATLTVGNFSLADADSKLNFTGAGKVIMTQDVIFGNLTGANGTPAQASDFTGLGTLELAENVTLYMGTGDTDADAVRVSNVKLADNVIMKGGSKLSINATTAEIASNFVMTNATIDYTDLASAGVAKLNGNIELHGSNTINARWTGNQNYQINGVISGDGSLSLTTNQAKNSGYIYYLSGNNTYSGGTTIAAGTPVMINNGSAFGTGAVTNNGTIQLESVETPNDNQVHTVGTITIANTISGAGNITDLGGNFIRTVEFTGDLSNWTGTFTRNGGDSGYYFKRGTTVKFTGNATDIGGNVTVNTSNRGNTSRVDVVVDNAAHVDFNGNIDILHNAPTVDYRGKLSTEGTGTKTFNGTINVGHLATSGGDVTFTNTVSVGNVENCTMNIGATTTMSSLTLNGTGTLNENLTVNGTLTLAARGAANSDTRIAISNGKVLSTENGAWTVTGTANDTRVFSSANNTAVSGSSAAITFKDATVTYTGTGEGTLSAVMNNSDAVSTSADSTLKLNTANLKNVTAAGNVKVATNVAVSGAMTVRGNVTLSNGKSLTLSGDAATLEHDAVTYSKGTVLGYTSTDGKDFSLWSENATITGGKISVAAGNNSIDRNIGAALDGTDLTFTSSGYVVLNGTQNIGALEATQAGRTLHVGGTYYGRTREGDVTVDSISGFSTITVENVTVDGTEKKSSFAVNDLGTVKQNGSTAATITGATLAGATDTANASISGTSTTELAQMTSLTLEAAASIDLRHVTMTDSSINAGTNSATISYGDDVKVVASTAATTEGMNLTATTVQSGGSASGSLTVDVAYSLLDANRGKTLTWTIFDGVALGEGFTLQLGDVLTGIVNNGLPKVTLTVNGQEHVLSHEDFIAQTRAAGYNLLGGFDIAPAIGSTVILTVENIPEPATGTLSVLALAALASRRRRKH